MAKHRIIIDCDPGIDDATALFWALAAPEQIDVLAITTVVGNVPLSMTETNARRILTLAGRPDVPVYAGCPRPLMRTFVREAAVHGEDGLGKVPFPAPQFPLTPGHSVDFIIDSLMSEPSGSVTLCPIGPLTNVALAMVKAPEIVPRIKEIVFMGGAAFKPGNVTPAAEFNVHADPHAAQIVVSSGAPCVMHGLDVTHQAIATDARVKAINDLGNPVSDSVAAMLRVYGRNETYLHDPCVIAYLLHPEIFTGQRGHLTVDCQEGPNWGRTVFWPTDQLTGQTENATVISALDAEAYFRELTAALQLYG